jgi:hypothetical protein
LKAFAVTISSVALFVFAGWAAAAEPPRPWPPGERPDGGRERGERWEEQRGSRSEMRSFGRGARLLDPEVVESSWDDARETMQELTPHGWAAFDRMPESEMKERMRSRIVSRYLELANEPAELQEIISERMRLEDQIFGTVMQARQSGEELDRSALRAQVGELVEMHLQERRYRVRVLEDSLSEERARLENDLEQREHLVDRHLERWLHGSAPGERRRPMRGTRGGREGWSRDGQE